MEIPLLGALTELPNAGTTNGLRMIDWKLSWSRGSELFCVIKAKKSRGVWITRYIDSSKDLKRPICARTVAIIVGELEVLFNSI
jgi:hypothetical protein